jgi:hypothetical protein
VDLSLILCLLFYFLGCACEFAYLLFLTKLINKPLNPYDFSYAGTVGFQ